MKSRSLATLLAALAVPALAGPGTAAAQEVGPLTYGVPTPPAVSYVVADTTVMTMEGTPLGDMTMTMIMQMRLDLDFAEDPDGVRVTGVITIEHATMSNDMMGDMSMGDELGEQTIEFVMNERGVIQAVTIPELAGLTGIDLGPSNDLTAGLFPKWPARAIRPGDTWADTLEVTPDMVLDELGASMEGTTVTINSYTLEGDTGGDADEILRIAVEGMTVADIAIDADGEQVTGNLATSVSGFHLWDADRSLVLETMTVTDIDGSTFIPGLGAVAITAVQTHHMRLIN
ncbi:MAG: hypothetical protein F4187_10660 [Gemmatimonadetes bacterium]|nr:hypothetical protein [Gemmatimonadota bacterium]MYI07528.1 hypothetical protein [Gemmatimonadota bacterium]